MVSWLFLLLSLPSLLFLSFDSKKKFAPRSAPSRQKTFVRVATDQNETGRIEKNNEKQQLCKKPLLTAISFFLLGRFVAQLLSLRRVIIDATLPYF